MSFFVGRVVSPTPTPLSSGRVVPALVASYDMHGRAVGLFYTQPTGLRLPVGDHKASVVCVRMFAWVKGIWIQGQQKAKIYCYFASPSSQSSLLHSCPLSLQSTTSTSLPSQLQLAWPVLSLLNCRWPAPQVRVQSNRAKPQPLLCYGNGNQNAWKWASGGFQQPLMGSGSKAPWSWRLFSKSKGMKTLISWHMSVSNSHSQNTLHCA